MSYASTMMVNEGVVMLVDKQVTQPNTGIVFTKTAQKLFTMGDNIGVSLCAAMYTRDGQPINVLLEQFCKEHTYDSLKYASAELFEYLKTLDVDDSYCGIVVQLAGYDKVEHEYEMFFISIKDNYCCSKGDRGMLCLNAEFRPYGDQITNNPLYNYYTLQDAIDISKLGVDFCRGIKKYLHFQNYISEDVDIIAITSTGIQWIQKKELEYK